MMVSSGSCERPVGGLEESFRDDLSPGKAFEIYPSIIRSTSNKGKLLLSIQGTNKD